MHTDTPTAAPPELPGCQGAPLPPSRPRLAWVAVDDAALARGLAHELGRRGWRVGLVTSRLRPLLEALDGAASDLERPQLLVSGVRFDDGDAFSLIRRLGPPQAPALALVSRQQRAVIRAALSLAEHQRVRVVTVAELPGAVGPITDAVEQGVRGRGPDLPWVRPPLPPLTAAALGSMLAARRIVPFLQPKMRMDTHEVVGFEALMRASDGAGGLVTPDRLIEPLLEHGLLGAATLQLAQQTVDFVAACLHRGLGISASINVSLTLMADVTFCSALLSLVEASGVDPSWLTLEITETEAMADAATVIEHTGRIRMLGFNLSIDDFGSAYSSLVQLSKIPFSELKIERAFVQNMQHDPTKRAIVGACAHLGRALGLNVVAEGVETVDELRAVQASGCTAAQGYLVARPMPVAQAAAWLESLQRDGGVLEVRV